MVKPPAVTVTGTVAAPDTGLRITIAGDAHVAPLDALSRAYHEAIPFIMSASALPAAAAPAMA